MKYEIIKNLGSGSYATVFLIKSLKDYKNIHKDDILAFKQFKEFDKEDGISPSAFKELSIHKNLKHPHIVNCRFPYYEEKNKRYCLVMDYYPSTLREKLINAKMEKNKLDYIYNFGGINISEIKRLLFEILSGVYFLHKNNYIHRDLKPDNILIDKNDHIRIGDFGMILNYNFPVGKIASHAGTQCYRAPEIIYGYEKYSYPIDIWSIGCLFYEMIFGKLLFSGINKKDEELEKKEMFRLRGSPSENHWKDYFSLPKRDDRYLNYRYPELKNEINVLPKEIIDLLEKLLELDPSKRISSIDALQHIFFKDLSNYSKIYSFQIK
jgi:serine/threonine protein kinase